MMNMRGPRPMHRMQGPHGHPGPARHAVPGGHQGHQGPGGLGGPGPGPGGPPGMRGPGPMRPPGPGPQGMTPGMRPMGVPVPGPGGPGPGPVQRVPRPQAPPPASNITNDPSNAHSRIFVGNLNTILMKKEDVEQIFRRYGIVSGISMHKGYAFVQYSRPDEARRASMSEDGKTYASQKLDINIASEPKKGNKRAAMPGRVESPMEKKKKMDGPAVGSGPGGRTLVSVGGNFQGGTKLEASATSITLARPTGKALKKTTISTGNDILVCGTCKSLYHSLATFVQHKKQKCELKTVCKCQQIQDNEVREPAHLLLCAVCDAQFASAWDLCQHCQDEHSIAIFKETELQEVNGND